MFEQFKEDLTYKRHIIGAVPKRDLTEYEKQHIKQSYLNAIDVMIEHLNGYIFHGDGFSSGRATQNDFIEEYLKEQRNLIENYGR